MKKWSNRLWLNEWHLYMKPSDKPIVENDSELFPVIARCNTINNYKKATITIDSKLWANMGEVERRRTIIHELVHVVNSQIEEYIFELLEELPSQKRNAYEKWFVNVREQTAEHWTNVLGGAYKDE